MGQHGTGGGEEKETKGFRRLPDYNEGKSDNELRLKFNFFISMYLPQP